MEPIPVSKLKAEALGIVERVSRNREEVLITKRGVPVARLVPVAEPRSLVGSVEFLVPDEELLKPIDETWDAEVGELL